jgi:hypothetical protein
MFSFNKCMSFAPLLNVGFALVFVTSCKVRNQSQLLDDKQTSAGQEVNLSDEQSRVDAILTLAEREPRLPVGPHGFPRDPWQVMDLLERLYAESKEGLHASVIPKDARQYQYAYEGSDYKINEEALAQIRSELAAHKRAVEEALGRPLHSMVKDILELKDKIANQAADPKLLTRLLTLIPVAYSGATEEYLASGQDIADLKHSDLANHYKDTYPEHLAAEISKYFDDTVIKSFENQFIHRKLASALEYLKGQSGQVPKMVFLEEISGFTAVFRACFGNDCSLKSVPFYALDEQTKVFLIRSQQAGGVKGYVLVTQARINGQSYPYVVTVNGSLSADQVSAAVRLVASVLDAPEMLLPDFAKAGAIVNTPAMREGMRHASSERSVQVEMNPNWKRISDFTAAHNKTGLSNYYNPVNLDQAFLGSVAPVEYTTELLKDVFKSGAMIRAKPLLERAKMAVILEANLTPQSLAKVLSTLGVDAEQLQAAKPLARMSEDHGLSVEEYHRAKQVFGFGAADIKALHPLTRVRVLAGLAAHREQIPEIKFEKEALDYAKWAKSQLASHDLPVDDVAAYKQKIWDSFVDLSRRIQLPQEDLDAVVKLRPAAEVKPLAESITKGLWSAPILAAVVRSSEPDYLRRADASGLTPLMVAVINGHDLLVEALLQRGMDPEEKNASGESASSLADEWRRPGIQALFKQYATMNSPLPVSDGISSLQKPKDPCETIRGAQR